MKTPGRVLVMALVAALLVGACATVPVSQRDRAVERLVDTINEGSVEEIVELSRVPFVLDKEIIALEGDVATMWERLHEAGFSLPDYRIASVEPVDKESYRTFGSTMELRVYFRKYLASDGAIATVKSDNGTFLLLLGDRQWFTPELFGIMGPVR